MSLRCWPPEHATVEAAARHWLAGGQEAQRGRNRVERANGEVEELGHIGKTDMGVGDVFVIETPGGGGFGKG